MPTPFAHTSVRPPTLNQAASTISKTIMAAYRWLGFAVLAFVLIGVASYIALHLLYLVHKAWVMPVIISPTDARVLDLTARTAQQSWLRQQVDSARAELQVKVNRAQRRLDVEKAYQQGLEKAIGADALARAQEIRVLGQLSEQYRKAKQEIGAPTQAFSELSRERSEQQLSAKLIDEDTMTARRQALADMAQTQLSLREKQLELSAKMSNLSRSLTAFQELSGSFSFVPNDKALSYEALKVAHEYHESVLAARSAEDEVTASKEAFMAFDKTTAHYDQLLKTLESAPLVRAATQKLTLAFIPYENLKGVQTGTVVYACDFQVLWCRRAGQVRSVLEGEVFSKHVLFGWDARGQYVEIDVEDQQAMKLPVLHLNRPPLLF
jgi:hypothetical protein